MQISDEQVLFFRTHGYLALPEFYSPAEVAAMQAELQSLGEAGLLRNVATEGDGKTHSSVKANLQLCPMSPHSLLFRAMPFHPSVVSAVRRLIGDPVVLHLDQVFLKPGQHGSGTNWHQDNAYFKIADPLKGTAMWTAVHEATLTNGTIHVLPDSFHEALEHSRDPESDHHIRCYPDESRAVPVELPAGGVVFFAYGTPHCTHGNRTDKERAGVALHFLNGDVIGKDYFHPDEAMKHPVLTGDNADNGSGVYGEPMTGLWEREVSRYS